VCKYFFSYNNTFLLCVSVLLCVCVVVWWGWWTINCSTMIEVTTKTALVTVTLTCTALFSGALFGWATLQLIFEEDGVFSRGCEGATEDEVCGDRQNKFSLMYNVAAAFMAFGSFCWGSFVDRMGPVWASLAVSGRPLS
jgi:hypothetical protein